MKVILDGVFNHCGSFNKWMDRECIYEGKEGYEPGAYVSADSPYRDFLDSSGKRLGLIIRTTMAGGAMILCRN